jgi:hypothetical protein
MSLVFAYFTSNLGLETPYTSDIATSSWIIYTYFAMLAWQISIHNDTNFVRIWRTLPLRESTQANLAWIMSAVAPPVFSFLIILLWECVGFCLGNTDLQSIAWPLLFLLIATLCSGLITFVNASMMFGYARATDAREAQRRGLLSISYAVKFFISLGCAGVPLVLMLRPTPSGWSDLGYSHFVGMGLAAWLTWKSFRMRYCLLQFDFLQKRMANVAPKMETAAIHHGSPLAALAQELKTMVRRILLVGLSCIGLVYLVLFCMAWSGLAPRGSDLYEVSAQMLALLVFLSAALLVFGQLSRISELKMVRSLPLTANQSVLLFLSYPYAVSLAVIPCMSVPLWLTGYGQLLALLLAGSLICAGLCPFAMLILARFGGLGFIWMIMMLSLGAGSCSFATMTSSRHSTPPSTFLLCMGVLLLTVLGAGGYYGMRHLIENSSAVYKRKLFPQQFGQGVGR